MATPAWVPLASTTLSSSASSVTFGSIPSGYKDLTLVVQANNTTTDEGTRVRVNSDSGSNYPYVYMRGNGSTATSGSGTLTYIAGSDNFSAVGSIGIYQFMDYSATDKHKTILTRGGIASDDTKAYATRWVSTSAITTIEISPTGNQFASGSTFSLWGRNAL